MLVTVSLSPRESNPVEIQNICSANQIIYFRLSRNRIVGYVIISISTLLLENKKWLVIYVTVTVRITYLCLCCFCVECNDKRDL